jgi:hypothetical protein
MNLLERRVVRPRLGNKYAVRGVKPYEILHFLMTIFQT